MSAELEASGFVSFAVSPQTETEIVRPLTPRIGPPWPLESSALPCILRDIQAGGPSTIIGHMPEDESASVVVEVVGPDGSRFKVKLFCGGGI
jgi:hypothetical protein